MTPDPRIASESAALLCNFVFEITLSPLYGLLHVNSIGVRKGVLPLASLKFLIQCTVNLIFDMFFINLARTMTISW